VPETGSPQRLSDLQVVRVVSMPFDENTYIAYFSSQRECLVFDPGLEPRLILDALAERSLTPAAILCTHGHCDHIAGNGALKQRWPNCPLLIGAGDAVKLTDAEQNLSAPFGLPITSPPADFTLAEGERFAAAGLELFVFDTPGHSSGHVIFLCKQSQPWRVFGGDVLFRGSIGRTDFPDGDADMLSRMIHEKLFTLPDDTIVHPGHGPDTTIGQEKRTNPFVGAPSGYGG
jgi:glyoxylase-like metal-dependent hydrolase (beta-lactamase superfamily II)